ncbi:MAG: hypothetical protein M1457_03360 [bacterium]|nr:hypothetical protein [bacterium]
MKADLEGHQRGLNFSGQAWGDGTHTDMGAYEALPVPVSLWLPDGGPADIGEGQALAVAWRMEPPAGTTIRLRLVKAGRPVGDLGEYSDAAGNATATITLPAPLATDAYYAIVGEDALIPIYTSATAFFTITGTGADPAAAAPGAWTLYE